MEELEDGGKKRPKNIYAVENRLVVAKGRVVREGWVGSLGLVDANYYI